MAILGLWSCLGRQALIAAPATAQVVDMKPAHTHLAMDSHDLVQHWVHAGEEEQPGSTMQIFRPAASRKFPPSRFRMAYKFAANGTCEIYVLSPDDAHHFKPCHWTIDDSDEPILRISANGTTIPYRIVQLTGQILRLAPFEFRRNR
ncbi:MAG: hypothetical protein WCI65_03050 [Synechococcaceae cyanobacterium ELA263]